MIGSSEGRAAGPVKADSRRMRGRWSAFTEPPAPGPHSAARHRRFIHITPFLHSKWLGKNLERCTKKPTCKKVGSPDPAAPTARMFAVCHVRTLAPQQNDKDDGCLSITSSARASSSAARITLIKCYKLVDGR